MAKSKARKATSANLADSKAAHAATADPKVDKPKKARKRKGGTPVALQTAGKPKGKPKDKPTKKAQKSAAPQPVAQGAMLVDVDKLTARKRKAPKGKTALIGRPCLAGKEVFVGDKGAGGAVVADNNHAANAALYSNKSATYVGIWRLADTPHGPSKAKVLGALAAARATSLDAPVLTRDIVRSLGGDVSDHTARHQCYGSQCSGMVIVVTIPGQRQHGFVLADAGQAYVKQHVKG